MLPRALTSVEIRSDGHLVVRAGRRELRLSVRRAERIAQELVVAARVAKRAQLAAQQLAKQDTAQLWLLTWRPPAKPLSPGRLTGLEESQLAAGIVARRELAQDTRLDEARLLRSLLPLLQRTAGAIVGRAGTLAVEDLVQEGVSAVLARLEAFDARRGPFAPWAQREARKAMLRYCDRQRSDVHLSDWARQWGRAQGGMRRFRDRDVGDGTRQAIAGAPTDAVAIDTVLDLSGTEDVEGKVAAAEELVVMAGALRELTRAQAEAVRRTFGVGRERQSIADIAQALGISTADVREALRTGMARLRARMEGA